MKKQPVHGKSEAMNISGLLNPETNIGTDARTTKKVAKKITKAPAVGRGTKN